MISITIHFVLKAINLETVRHRELPDCYDFAISVRHTTGPEHATNTTATHESFKKQFYDKPDGFVATETVTLVT